MAAIYPVQLSMARGEITPFAHARADIDHYALGLAVARNWLVMRYGGLTRKPGSFFDNATKTPAKKSELRWFNFSQAQNYALEFGDLYVRFHTISGRVETGPGVAYEVATPYTEAELPFIVVQQAGDILYIACKGHYPYELKRIAETNWTMTQYTSDFGPYLNEDIENTTALYPNGYASAVPHMTGPSTPSGMVNAAANGAFAWLVFDKEGATEWSDTANNVGHISYSFGGGITKIVDAYWLRASSGGSPSGMPATWQFQAWNGTGWITLDARNNEVGWGGGETRFYEFQNNVAYTDYRLEWSSTGYTGGAESRIAEMGWHEEATTQPGMTLTASSTAFINGGVGFLATDVGRWMRLLGSDNRWRNAKITTYFSPTSIYIKLYDHALPNTAPFRRWQMGAFSTAPSNSPAVVSMYENRLAMANTPANPLDAWFSKSADFDNGGVSIPVVDNDAVNIRMSNGQLNDILWMVEAGDLLVGTAGGLRVIGRNDPGKAFAPNNVKQKGQTAVRASSIQPMVIERTVLFAELHRKALYESAFSYEDDGYVALELTMLAEHIFTGGIKQMAYQDTPNKCLWVVLDNGEMAACTYDRTQKVFGVSPCDTDGLYESVVVLPGPAYDVPMFIVKRGARRDIERQADPFRVGRSNFVNPVYFDGCSYYSGAPTTTLGGLPQLAGLTVGYWADGADRGDIAVSAGGIATFPAAYSNIVIGRRYMSRGQTLRLAQAGNRDGGIMGRKVRVIKGFLDLLESYGIMAGSKSAADRNQLEKMVSSDDAETRPVVPALHTGFVEMHTDDNWEGNGVYVFETDKGYPATIRSIMTSVETEP
jgi:hypothetical protein